VDESVRGKGSVGGSDNDGVGGGLPGGNVGPLAGAAGAVTLEPQKSPGGVIPRTNLWFPVNNHVQRFQFGGGGGATACSLKVWFLPIFVSRVVTNYPFSGKSLSFPGPA
jgi:hypothetical protein